MAVPACTLGQLPDTCRSSSRCIRQPTEDIVTAISHGRQGWLARKGSKAGVSGVPCTIWGQKYATADSNVSHRNRNRSSMGHLPESGTYHERPIVPSTDGMSPQFA